MALDREAELKSLSEADSRIADAARAAARPSNGIVERGMAGHSQSYGMARLTRLLCLLPGSRSGSKSVTFVRTPFALWLSDGSLVAAFSGKVHGIDWSGEREARRCRAARCANEVVLSGYNRCGHTTPVPTPTISASRLADVCGIPRETVRRKLKLLEQRGWIRHEEGEQVWTIRMDGGAAQACMDLMDLDRRGLHRMTKMYAELERIISKSEVRESSHEAVGAKPALQGRARLGGRVGLTLATHRAPKD